MRTFDYTALRGRTWDTETLKYVARIHEYKGKQELYLRQKPIQLERLVEIAKIQSTEASNRIEGIVITQARLKKLAADKTTPQSRSEEEIIGYRDVLQLIHENYDLIPLTPNYILPLHRDLLRYTPFNYGGYFKTAANDIEQVNPDGTRQIIFVPMEPALTPAAVQDICDSYQRAKALEAIDDLILIPCFILDFLCIHPFLDGNGRMSRLLTLLLLYQSGYYVGKYISIEKAIADTKENYYAAMASSDQGWLEGTNDLKPFLHYMLGIILKCYRDLDDRLTIAERDGVRSTAADIVRQYVSSTVGSFSKADVLAACPSLGRSSAEAALKKLVEDGTLLRMGNGKRTRYSRNV